MFIVLLGTAGSGKTSLVARFYDWIRKEFDLEIGIANLDPGCERVPYPVDFDVRKFVTVRDLMSRENLGPNGAMIRAVECMENVLDRLCKISANKDLWLVDTPGQSEIFVFRKVGPSVIETLDKEASTVGVYLVDSELAESASGLVSSFSLALAVRLRLVIPLIMILSKADLIDRKIERLLRDQRYLIEEVIAEKMGSLTDLTLGLIELMRSLSSAQRIVKVSTKTGEGLSELYDLIHESLCECGDLT